MTSLVLVGEAPSGANKYRVRVTPRETVDTFWVEVFYNDVLIEAYDNGDSEYVPKYVTTTGSRTKPVEFVEFTVTGNMHPLPVLVTPRDRRPYYRLHTKSRY